MSVIFKLKSLDPNKVTFGQVGPLPGVRYVDRQIIKLSDIYTPPYTENPVRKDGLDLANIEGLAKCFSMGIDYSQKPPVVRKIPAKMVDGIRYEYELIDGNHRIAAMTSLGYDEWIFDIYEFCLDGYSFEDSVRTFQLHYNTPVVQLAASTADYVNTISRLISNNSKLVQNNEKSINEYIEKFCPYMHYKQQASIVNQVIAKNGSYQDVVTFTPKNLESWLKKNTDFKYKGEYDSKRNMYGWTCLGPRYEFDSFYNSLKKYSDTGKESYIIAHTFAPTETKSLQDQRMSVYNNIKSIEEVLLNAFNFYAKHKRFPTTLTHYIPQDRANNEDKETPIPVEVILESNKSNKPISEFSY